MCAVLVMSVIFAFSFQTVVHILLSGVAAVHWTCIVCKNNTGPKLRAPPPVFLEVYHGCRDPLKFEGVPQTPEPVSAISGPKFTNL